MKWLLKLIFGNKKYVFFFFIALMTLVAETAATRLELGALGIAADDLTRSPQEAVSIKKTIQPPFPSVKEIIDSPQSLIEWFKSKNDSKRDVIAEAKQFLGLDSLEKIALFVLIIASFKAITLFSANYTNQVISIRISKELRDRYFQHLQSLPLSFYQKFHIGSLSNRVVGDATTIAESLHSILTNYVQTPLMFLTGVGLCLILSAKLSLVVFIGIPLIIIPVVALTKKIKHFAKQMLKNQESFASVLIDFLAGIQTVKLFAMENYSLSKYKEQNDQLASYQEKSARYTQATRPIVHFIGSLTLAVTMLIGLHIFNMSLAEIISFAVVLHSLYEPLKKFAEENARIQRGVAAAERMFEVLNIVPNIQDKNGAINLPNLKDCIQFKDVHFTYPESPTQALRGVSFTIKKGKTTAIVGPSGAGKTTIAQLLPRLYEIDQGQILFDGESITNFKQKSLKENISFVPQKPFLFCDSVSDNISHGKDFSDEEIQIAAKKAHADEFIQNLPNKYKSILSEAGKNLSGGQQQRLAIARALVKKAPILVMDEATSSLDNVSEKRIQAAIEELHGTITQVIIAHRLSTIEHADEIIFLEQGKVLGQGPKDILLEECPEFKEMWEIMTLNKKGKDYEL